MFVHNITVRRLDLASVGAQDADVIGECLNRDPLQNIYLIDALQRARVQRTKVRQTFAAHGFVADESPVGAFWGAFAQTTPAPDASSGPDEASGKASEAGTDANEPGVQSRRPFRLEAILFVEPGGRAGHLVSVRGHTCATEIACAAQTGPTPDEASGDEALVRLGLFAARSGVRTLVGQRTRVQRGIEGLGDRWRVQTRRVHFYRADPERLVRCYDHTVRRATTEDTPGMVELYRGYEFSRRDITDSEIQHEILNAMNESGVYFVVEHPRPDVLPPDVSSGDASSAPASSAPGAVETNKRFISAARVYPETDRAGLIGAARTLPEFRGRGIYLSVRTACFEHLYQQGKVGLGMFLDSNTSMHRVIDKQGGTILGEWLIADIRRTLPLRRQIIPSRARQWALKLMQRLMQ